VRLADDDKLHEAYILAVQAEKVIPSDSVLTELWNRFSMYITIHSQPEGANVFWKEYSVVDAPWIPLGRTPLDSIRLPVGLKRFMISMEGFQKRYIAPSIHPDIQLRQLSFHLIIDGVKLDREKDIPDNMVRVFPVKMLSNTNNEVKGSNFNDFLIDKYEVTNKEYKVFVDSGGYQRKEYWKNPFVKDGRIIPWERAVTLFKDKTGRVGPATWEAGDYPTGQENYPVNGVSWYEAAAYGEFIGKSLPTIYHWERAAGFDAAPDIIPLSNFGDLGPTIVGMHQGMGPYGTYDMAGNVREWCWNQKIPGEKRFIRGGAWTDQVYEFTSNQVALSPFDRSATNGFRCMKYLVTDSNTIAMNKPVKSYLRDVYNEKPVSEKEFNVILRMYNYPKTPLHAVVEKIDTHEKDWTVEKITYDAAYGNERVSTYLFLPKKGRPPYQTVVHFPGSSVMGMHPDGILKPYQTRCFDFILKSGRAVLHPIYQGTFERSYTPPQKMWDGGYLQRDFVIMCAKDLRRSLDYIETRSDIDTSKLAYYGLSWGAEQGGIMLAIEKRFKAGILYVGGFWIYNKPLLPEIEPLNFVSRVTIPILMLDGRNDDIYPYKMAQIPFFEFLGTPKRYKKHYVSDSWHFVPRDELIKESLGWLDEYLGPVQ
jgi:dienelactone hydrolase